MENDLLLLLVKYIQHIAKDKNVDGMNRWYFFNEEYGMKHYLASVGDLNLLSTQLGAAVTWLKMIKPDIKIEEMPKVGGVYQVIVVKEKGKEGESFSAKTYKELMEKVNETVLRCCK